MVWCHLLRGWLSVKWSSWYHLFPNMMNCCSGLFSMNGMNWFLFHRPNFRDFMILALVSRKRFISAMSSDDNCMYAPSPKTIELLYLCKVSVFYFRRNLITFYFLLHCFSHVWSKFPNLFYKWRWVIAYVTIVSYAYKFPWCWPLLSV